MWSPSLRGAFGRLISFPLSAGQSDRCLTFYYKLYGPNTGDHMLTSVVKNVVASLADRN